jgi:uncharacterized membrane protein
MDSVSVLRALHVAGAVHLLGNVTVTGFWATYLYRARAVLPFGPVARAILWSDLVFTLLGGALLTVSGILLVMRRGFPILQTPWLLQGIGALAVSTLVEHIGGLAAGRIIEVKHALGHAVGWIELTSLA